MLTRIASCVYYPKLFIPPPCCVNFDLNCIAHNTLYLAFDIVVYPFDKRIDTAFKAAGKPCARFPRLYYYCRLTYGWFILRRIQSPPRNWLPSFGTSENAGGYNVATDPDQWIFVWLMPYKPAACQPQANCNLIPYRGSWNPAGYTARPLTTWRRRGRARRKGRVLNTKISTIDMSS